MGQLDTAMNTATIVSLLSLCLLPLTTRASPHPLLNLILGGEKGESDKQIEEVFGGPPCTVPEVINQKVECKASLENHCNNVYEDYCITEQVGEECKKEVRKDCKKVYTTECVTEWVRECEQEEYVESGEGEPVKKQREYASRIPSSSASPHHRKNARRPPRLCAGLLVSWTA